MNTLVPHGKEGGTELVVPSSQAARVLLDSLNWVYDRAIGGGYGFSGAEETAEAYRAEAASIEEAINSLIRWQVAKGNCSPRGSVGPALPGCSDERWGLSSAQTNT